MTEPIKNCPQPDPPELVMRADGYHYQEDEMKDTQRELTDEQIEHIAATEIPSWFTDSKIKRFARAIISVDRALNAPADLEHQSAGKPVAWLLTDKKINDIQVDSVQRLIDRARQAHFTDLIIRINGKDEHYQADWLKHLVRAEVPVCAPADRDVMRQLELSKQADSRAHAEVLRLAEKLRKYEPGSPMHLNAEAPTSPAEHVAWQHIDTAPKDNKRPLYLARFDGQGVLRELSFDGSWEYWQESWELSHINGYAWESDAGIEEPTHWSYQDSLIPPAPTPELGDPAEPRDDSDRTYTKPIGYLPAYELLRLHSGHDAQLRSAKFGPSVLDGDVPVFIEAPTPPAEQPIDMVLHCSACGMQHIDTPEYWGGEVKVHRSHLCVPDAGGCGHIWRPADVPTNGVAAIKTKGKDDSAPAEQQGEKSEANPPLPTDLLYAANKRAVPSEAKLRCRKCGDSYEITFNHAVSQSEGVGQEGPAEQQGEPDYPVGEVAGACVCGGWPGGECLKCPKVEQEPIIYKRSEFTKNWTTFNVRREHADAAEARLKSSSLATLRAKVEALPTDSDRPGFVWRKAVLAEIDKLGDGA